MSNEIKGVGNSYTAQFWEYDSRIGRRWNLDPKPTVGVSQYSAFNNTPIWRSDLLGDTSIIPSFDKFIKTIPKTDFTIKKEDRKPLLDITGALTLGTVGFNTEIGNVGFSFAGQFGERDLIGFRDDKLYINGKAPGDKEATTRTGFSAALAGFGGAFSYEGQGKSNFTDPKFLEKKDFKSSLNVPFVTYEETSSAMKKTNAKDIQSKVSLLDFKAGFIIGVEFKVELNLGGAANSFYVPYSAPDNTNYKIRFIPTTLKTN